MAFTINDYELTTSDFGEKILKRSDGAFIPYECWDNRDWIEYAKLANLQEG